MSDKQLAAIGRNLARSLARYGRERDPNDAKVIAQLHTDLCLAYREELLAEEQAKQQPEEPKNENP